MNTTVAAPGVLHRHRALLPVTEQTPPLTLHEGDTPLIAAPRLADWVGVDELFLKFEGLNPTGSFKDRGMVVAVAKAAEAGAHTVLCASTGNTAASAAAYAARAGLDAVVLLPAGSVAPGKMAQAVAHGARVIALETNFDGALEITRTLADRYAATLVNSVNPHRLEGQATAAYEICDALGDAPDVLALPVGNGGNITAYWRGFRRYREHGASTRLPRMLGAQAAGAAPLVRGEPVAEPETVASAIRIGHPATWQPALDAARDSGGHMRAVSDDEILAAYRRIARLEGVFCEPASATGVAGLRAAVRGGERAGASDGENDGGREGEGDGGREGKGDGGRGGGGDGGPDREDRIRAHSRCVCVLTGHGLKDPERALPESYQPRVLPDDAQAVAAELGWTG